MLIACITDRVQRLQLPTDLPVPGDRETLAYFKTVDRGFAPRPMVAGARLSLIHVADLAEAVVRALESDLAASVYEVDDGHPGGHTYDDMARADTLVRYPQLLAAPGVVAIVWGGLFDRFEHVDVRAMMRAHFEVLFGQESAS